ncbi:hypothetical protein Tco_1120612 [Tanacetum coccineum]
MGNDSAEATGVKSDGLFDKVYSQTYKDELIKDMWTDNMMKYYLMRCDEIKCDQINGHYNDFVALSAMDEVEEVRHGFASFIVHNDVSNGIDGSMSQMQGCYRLGLFYRIHPGLTFGDSFIFMKGIVKVYLDRAEKILPLRSKSTKNISGLRGQSYIDHNSNHGFDNMSSKILDGVPP